MKVLSLFDGMSCGRIALERAGLSVSQYFASEIDKYAITVSNNNYPDIIQLYDVRKIRHMAESGFFGKIDLLIGGSPCQGFSFAGKQLAFDDPRSALFFEFVWTLKALQRDNPDIKFMLENVRMKKEHMDVITGLLGVQPVCINSALVSAQNRVRYYWCNWHVEQPEDKGILLKDITINGENKIGRMTGRKINPETGKRDDYNEKLTTEQRIEPRLDNKSGCLTTVQKDNLVLSLMNHNTRIKGINFSEKGWRPYKKDGKNGSLSEIGFVTYENQKAQCITSTHAPKIFDECFPFYRPLTPIECERLQTVPDNYTAGVSNTQRYKMLGNGWTVDVIANNLRSIPR